MSTPDDLLITVTDVTEDQVVAYLSCHPDFLRHYPDLIAIPPSRWQAGKVVDLQYFMIDRLREELDSLRDCADELLQTTHSNMSTQERTHQAVLALVGADGFTELCRTVSEDLPALLAVDVITLGLEPDLSLSATPMLSLANGTIDQLLGTHEILLRDNRSGDPILFGETADTVHSDALVRLHPGPNLPQGLLVLGARGADTFHTGQGTELLVFLARVLELCVRRWLTVA